MRFRLKPNLNGEGPITATCLWSIIQRLFAAAANVVDNRSPATVDKAASGHTSLDTPHPR